MPRRNNRNGAPHEGGNKQQARSSTGNRVTPQMIRDCLEYLRTKQNSNEGVARPTTNAAVHPEPVTNESKPIPNPSSTNVNGRPSVPLPHNLGHISVPPGAQRVDVRFNCVTNRLPTGLVADNMVVNVDVVYNPGVNPAGTGVVHGNDSPVKKEEHE